MRSAASVNGGLDGVGGLGERSALVVSGVLADAPGERNVAWAWGVGPPLPLARQIQALAHGRLAPDP